MSNCAPFDCVLSIDLFPLNPLNVPFACRFIINGNAPAVAISLSSVIACWVFVLVRPVRDLIYHSCVILPDLTFVIARKSSDRHPKYHMDPTASREKVCISKQPTASEDRMNRSMADDTALVNGSYELDDPSMKNPESMEDQPYMPKNGDGLTNSTSDLWDSQKTTRCRSSLARLCTGLLTDAHLFSRLRAPNKHHVLLRGASRDRFARDGFVHMFEAHHGDRQRG